MSQLNAAHSLATPQLLMCSYTDIQVFHFMAKWITASSRFISKIFCRAHMLTLTFHDNKWCPIKAVGFSEDAGTLCFEQVHLKIFIHIIIIFFFLQHLSSVIGAILRHKLCRFHLRRDSHRCVWLCWISSRPIAESPIHASSFVGGCEHYINIPGAFFERKAYNSGGIDTVQLEHENRV